MTPLGQRMLEDIEIRNLSDNTQPSYLKQVSSFARYFHNVLPKHSGWRRFAPTAHQVHLATEQTRPVSLRIIASALRFPYKVTLKHAWVDAAIPLPKKPFKLLEILSREVVARSSSRLPPHRSCSRSCALTGKPPARSSGCFRAIFPADRSVRTPAVLGATAPGLRRRRAALLRRARAPPIGRLHPSPSTTRVDQCP